MRKLINRKTINIIFAVIGIVIILYMIYLLKGYINEVDFGEVRFNPIYLLCSFAVVPIWFSLRSYIWKFILKNMGEEISLIDSMRLIGVSNFGKYIPGKVWFTVGRTVLAERLGIPKRKSFTSIIIDTYFLLLSSSAFLLILILKISFKGYNYIPWALGFIGIMIPFIFPYVMKRVMNFIFKMLKKESVEFHIPLKSIALIIFADFLIWGTQGLQFYFLLKSVIVFHFSPFISMLIYPGAWAMGFMVLFMPAGLGIREGLITYALIQIFPQDMKGMAIIAAMLSRIQFTLSEISYLITLIGSKKIWRTDEKGKN